MDGFSWSWHVDVGDLVAVLIVPFCYFIKGQYDTLTKNQNQMRAKLEALETRMDAIHGRLKNGGG